MKWQVAALTGAIALLIGTAAQLAFALDPFKAAAGTLAAAGIAVGTILLLWPRE